MNYMAEVAKLLGVELGEEFECSDGTCCVFDNNDVFNVVSRTNNICMSNRILGDLLMGVLTIIHKPWKPKSNELFWFVLQNGDLDVCYRKNVWFDTILYKIGNCYRTQVEAEANRDKWVSFYASDEILEV